MNGDFTAAETAFLMKDVFWLPCTKPLNECREVRVGEGVYMIEPRDFAAGGKSHREKQNVSHIRQKVMKVWQNRRGYNKETEEEVTEKEDKVRRFVRFASDWLSHSVCDPDSYHTLVLLHNGSSEAIAKFVEELCHRPAFENVREVILMDACMEAAPLHAWEECRSSLRKRPYKVTLTRDYMQLAQCVYRSYISRTHNRHHEQPKQQRKDLDDGYIIVTEKEDGEEEEEEADQADGGILIAYMNGTTKDYHDVHEDIVMMPSSSRRHHAIAYAVFLSTCVRIEREQLRRIISVEAKLRGSVNYRNMAASLSPSRFLARVWRTMREKKPQLQLRTNNCEEVQESSSSVSSSHRRVVWPYLVSLRASDNDDGYVYKNDGTNRALSTTSEDEVTYEIRWEDYSKRHGLIVAVACQSFEHAYASHIMCGKGCALTTGYHGEDIVPEQQGWEECFGLRSSSSDNNTARYYIDRVSSGGNRHKYNVRYVLLTTAVTFTTVFICRFSYAMSRYYSAKKSGMTP